MGIFSTIAARDALFVALDHSLSATCHFAPPDHAPQGSEIEPKTIYSAGFGEGTDARRQLSLRAWAVRMEYERIEAYPEYPYMYQLGLTWTF